jgi:hypothetical protein
MLLSYLLCMLAAAADALQYSRRDQWRFVLIVAHSPCESHEGEGS